MQSPLDVRSTSQRASFISRVTFTWIAPLIQKANARNGLEDGADVLFEEDAAHLVPSKYLPSRNAPLLTADYNRRLQRRGGKGGPGQKHQAGAGPRTFSAPHPATPALAWAVLRRHQTLLIRQATLVLLVLGIRRVGKACG